MIEDEEKVRVILLFGTFVPTSEKWLHQEPHRSKLERAIRYAEKHPPKKTDIKDLK